MRLEDYEYFLGLLLNTEYEKDENIFVYYGHMGGSYVTNYDIEDEDLYCETCGDSDTLVEDGIKSELITKYINLISSEKKLREWFFETYGILESDHGYVQTIKNIIREDINLEDDFWVVCPEGQDCHVPVIDDIKSFTDVLESDTPPECKFCALQNILWELDD